MYKLLYLRSTLTSCRSSHSRSYALALMFRSGRANVPWQTNWVVSSLEIACIQPQETRISHTGADTLHAFWEQSSLRLKSVGFMPLNWDVFSQVVYAGPCCWWKARFKASPWVRSGPLHFGWRYCAQPCRGLDQTKIPIYWIPRCLNQWSSGL